MPSGRSISGSGIHRFPARFQPFSCRKPSDAVPKAHAKRERTRSSPRAHGSHGHSQPVRCARTRRSPPDPCMPRDATDGTLLPAADRRPARPFHPIRPGFSTCEARPRMANPARPPNAPSKRTRRSGGPSSSPAALQAPPLAAHAWHRPGLPGGTIPRPVSSTAAATAAAAAAAVARRSAPSGRALRE